jgi:putative membrane protein
MIKALIVSWFVLAAAIALTAAIVPSVDVQGGFFTLLWVALLFGLVNALIGPLLRLISLPLTLMTFGLFALVINAVLLMLTAGLSDDLSVGGFFPAVLAAFLIALISTIIGFVVHLIVREPDASKS